MFKQSFKLSIIIPSAREENISDMLAATEQEFPGAQIIVSTDRQRKGKGWAVREGLSRATGDIIAFIDGDLDIHPRMIRRLLPHLEEFDIVVGKKDTRANIMRYIITLLSRLYIWFMFRIPVDTQTGVKVFKRDHIPTWETNNFAFDIEILAKAAGSKMFEVTIDAKRSKGMRFRSVFSTLLETFKIRGML